VDVSVAIMTHPRRRAEAEALAAAHPGLRAAVVVDPEPDAPGNLRCAAAAWAARRPEATHHLVLQDDCRLSERFAATVLDFTERYPHQALSLFTYWATGTAAALRTAAAAGCRVAEVRESYFPTVAAVLPAHLADGFAEFVSEHEGLPEADDITMGAYLYWRGVKRLAVIPSPVEHTGTVSLAGNEYQGDRESVCFEDDADPAGLSWDAAEPDAISGLDPTRTGQDHGYRARRNLPTRFFVAPWTHRHGAKALEAVGAGAAAETERDDAVDAYLAAEPATPPQLLSSLWLAGFTFGADLTATPVRTYAPEGPRTANRLPVDPSEAAKLLEEPVLAQSLRATAKGLGAFADEPVSTATLAEFGRAAIASGASHSRED
jgi:hypothetical protein